MTKKLKWRLSKLPTTEEVGALFAAKIITQDEAREILFSLETEESRDIESLKSEIKFLRELVEKLSDGKMSKIVETIRIIEKPYYGREWYSPYTVWCTSGASMGSVNTTSNFTLGATYVDSSNTVSNFSSINTF